MGRRRLAAALSNESCPRCGASRDREQTFCLDCGLRLPIVVGAVPALRARWLRLLGWYPGDWIWLGLASLLVATVGAAVAIAADHHRSAAAPFVPPAASSSASTTAATVPTPAPNGHTVWPAGLDGWTVVLLSSPQSAGLRLPRALAARAAHNGLPDVGILVSSGFSSLHPGYYVVFSGLFNAETDAETALATVQARGFGGAYARQIAR